MDNETSFWNKKQEDITVGDSLKVAGLVTIVSIADPLAALAAFTAGASTWHKFQDRREAKKAEKANK